MKVVVPLGTVIREAFLEVVDLSWAHTEKEEGNPVEKNSINKGAELRICMRFRGL